MIKLFQRALADYDVIGDPIFIYIRRNDGTIVVVEITLTNTTAQSSLYDKIIS